MKSLQMVFTKCRLISLGLQEQHLQELFRKFSSKNNNSSSINKKINDFTEKIENETEAERGALLRMLLIVLSASIFGKMLEDKWSLTTRVNGGAVNSSGIVMIYDRVCRAGQGFLIPTVH